MNQRELKSALKRLDAAIDAYLENRIIATCVMVAGIFLFHLLMLVFTGATGFVMTMALFVSLLAVGLVTGIMFLHDRYGGDNREQWLDVADIIESHLTGADVFNEWDDFLARPQIDPDIERVRQVCRTLPKQYPPTTPGEEMSPDGLDVLLAIVKDLRAGIATRVYEEILYWWYNRDDWREFRREASVRRAEARKAREEAGLPTGPFATGPLRHLVHLRHVLTLLILIGRGMSWLGVRVWRVIYGFLIGAKARRQQKRLRQNELYEDQDEQEQEYEYVEEYEDQADDEDQADGEDQAEPGEAEQTQPAAPAPASEPPKRHEHMPLPTATEDDEVAEAPGKAKAKKATVKKVKAKKVAAKKARTKKVTVKKTKVKKAKRQRHDAQVAAPRGKLSEARAIEKAMQSGLTAHDFDRKQEELTKLRGRQATPSETLTALLKERKKLAKAAKSGRPQAFAPVGMPRRIDARRHAELRHRAARRHRAGRPRLMLHRLFALVLMAALPAMPFVAWRMGEGQLLEIKGHLAAPTITPGDELNDVLRNPFESLFGNRSIELIDGPIFYVSAEDYNRCLEPVGVPKKVTLEAERLMLGGFTVARVIDIEHLEAPPLVIGVDPPLDLTVPKPIPEPRQRQRERDLSRAVIVTPK